MRLLSIATIVATLSIASIVNAQTATQTPGATQPAPATASKGPMSDNPEARARWEKFRAACSADLGTHCPNMQRGGEGRAEMRQCVETHKAKFTKDCQVAITERDAAREARKQAEPTAASKPKS